MNSSDLGFKVEELLCRYKIKGDKQRQLKRAILDLVDYWQRFEGSEDEYYDVADTVDGECQTDSIKIPKDYVLCCELDEQSKILLTKLKNGKEKHRNLESLVSPEKAVELRRKFIEHDGGVLMENLPFRHYNYQQVSVTGGKWSLKVMNACCENVIGYVPIPTGIAGPLNMNGELIYIPMATTEGALIASTNRGCRALERGVDAFVEDDKMTRAPVIEFDTVREANNFKEWMQTSETKAVIQQAFESTSKYAKLREVDISIVGTYVHLRFCAQTGDAMGMNMISKAVEKAMDAIDRRLHQFKYISISGNQCADKKASAINWLKGRGKTVHAEATLTSSIVKTVLKTSVQNLVDLGMAKLSIGTSTGISIGGWNAHAANVVAAIFLATGQDAAQVVSSSMCLTHLKPTNTGDLHVSCTLRCVEVGTVGGGTVLEAQQSNLKLLKCAGAHPTKPGENARRLATVIASAVLAGELSLLASQCSKDLVQSHMKLNRSLQSLPGISEETADKKISLESSLYSLSKPVDRALKHIVSVNCSSTF